MEDRLDVAFTLKTLDVDVVPLNFLHPIAGTPLEGSVPPDADGVVKNHFGVPVCLAEQGD